MNIELTAENAAALSKYAALAGCTPGEILNRYLTDNMVEPFQNPRSGDLESSPSLEIEKFCFRPVLTIESNGS
jgi:hypothetical protein